MGEFLSKVLLFPHKQIIDSDTRTVLLLEAANFQNFSKLQIERNFFTFTKNASYIFSFFEEMASEMVPLHSLKDADTYAEYTEHVEILEELYIRYEKLCEERSFIDPIFYPKNYLLNENFIKTLQKVEIEVVGMLTNFEISILEQIATIIPLRIVVWVSDFYTKMEQKLKKLGFTLSKGYKYTLDVSKKEIIAQEKLSTRPLVTLYGVSQRILQVALVKQKIYEFVEKGYSPDKIAVIVPQEDIAQYLDLFDTKNNFNFAMGKSFTQSFIYQKLKATLDLLDEYTNEHVAKLQRYGDELYSVYFGSYKKKLDTDEFAPFLEELFEHTQSTTEKKILQEEIYKILKIKHELQELNLRAVLHLFLNRLQSRSIDDVGGGKITVMGLLESRGIDFDAVIVVDFNEGYVPKKLKKDMFLNTTLRKHVGLPTQSEREELQKHYYYSIFSHAKESVICYVENEQQLPSRFLKELAFVEKKEINKNQLATVLFTPYKHQRGNEEEIVFEYDFTRTKLSSSKLKVFLTCRRKFFYMYIKNIQDFQIPQDIPQEWEIGRVLHQALKNLYEKKQNYSDVATLHKALVAELLDLQGNTELEKFQTRLYGKWLEPFCANEIQRFQSGYSVAYMEEPLELQLDGIKLYGVIDRIDKKETSLEVLDYKSGSMPKYTKNSVENATDFQLEFYYLLAQTLGNVTQVGYYDLKAGKIIQEEFFEQKMALLRQHFRYLGQTTSFDAKKCEDTKVCKLCQYNILCGRA
jgi:hypothetical protein